MEASEYLSTVTDMHSEARRRGLFFQTCADQVLVGRSVQIDGRDLLSFSSCSYLGIEKHPALIAGVHDAVDRYGTQFSSSRGYLSAPAYDELEDRLSELFGGHAIVMPSTTLGHQITLPVLASEKDAIVLDHQVHYSVQMAATLARASGTQVEMVKHGELEQAIDRVRALARTHRTVWFCGDGVYSMYGDTAPIGLLRELLETAENVRLYIDDAHGMSWAGQHGRGHFLSRFALSERVVVATSLNKAFSAAGGATIFFDRAERERVRICGGPMVFSGPVQPPMLGAALASAKLHLSPEIVEYQERLAARVSECNRALRAADLPLLVENESPIFFVRLGLPRVAFTVAERLKAEGLYVNVSMYPSVPMKRAGIRLTLTAAHSAQDVARVVDALARHVPAALAEEGLGREALDGLFARALPDAVTDSGVFRRARAVVTPGTSSSAGELRAQAEALGLTVSHARTIHQVDRDAWDGVCGARGACSWEAMALAERVFDPSKAAMPEHGWSFHYVLVRDREGRVQCATHFTESLNKDDMLMRAEVSDAVEERRRADPYFLTSKVLMTGSPLSEGDHVYVDRMGPWREALGLALEVGQRAYESAGANLLLLRDLPEGDREMDEFLLERGFVKAPMLDSHVLDVTWADEDELAARASKRARQYIREQAERASRFVVRSHGLGSLERAPLPAGGIEHLYQLYRSVAGRKRKINVFELPGALFHGFLESPAWEVVTLTLPEEHGGPSHGMPVAFFAAHVHREDYAVFLCGLDYDYVLSAGAYRQALFQMARRGRLRGARRVHLGMDADMEKSRYGTRIQRSCVYAQVADHYNGAILRDIVAQVGVGARRAG